MSGDYRNHINYGSAVQASFKFVFVKLLFVKYVFVSWEPALETLNSQDEEEEEEVKKKALQFSAINSDF